ncbi:MAG TPA: SoxR reducing system RseC family protein [Mesotoga infera]|jgi:sigma-E factor negative regulatory protein RseC|uniref:Positive regulator of sigma E activity n=1 Tax=Mesotoga infera TaxID=1236046 RepID=A0A7Z7LD52_9BACT|nr:SoxR reducing system RseC family protein [Mesotoga infera]MBP8660199.1 SoxR reducing system RseC family protein [Mesotoga sp.]NLI07584.1 SoxR reducing system RseC family protein [Thermotogaceae bacterium]SSC11756.1 Positive regulator of sigma E activity [Mesotoga infera]HNS66507.1 SoxR reducing system RseC family protein [Mesotoga infera]HOI34794.1 SoxR reducing system RseC family protein [Mesotoga infera]
MRELAIVKELKRDTVLLEKARTQACASCGSKNSCSVSQGDKIVTIQALRNDIEVEPGDTVEIETGKLSATRVAMIVYGIPLIVFLAVLIVVNTFLKSEGLAVGLAFASIAVVYGIISIYDRRNRQKLMPRIVRKVVLPDGFITQ